MNLEVTLFCQLATGLQINLKLWIDSLVWFFLLWSCHIWGHLSTPLTKPTGKGHYFFVSCSTRQTPRTLKSWKQKVKPLHFKLYCPFERWQRLVRGPAVAEDIKGPETVQTEWHLTLSRHACWMWQMLKMWVWSCWYVIWRFLQERPNGDSRHDNAF